MQSPEPSSPRNPLTERDRESGDPPVPVGTLETDRFCDHCGYNLRTQAVTRDAGTGILVCRCPECGALHAAGMATDAGRVWLGRLGTLVLFLWVLVLLSLAAGVLFGMGLLPYLHVEELTKYEHRRFTTPVGDEVVQRTELVRVLRTAPDDPFWRARWMTGTRIFVGSIGAASAAMGGIAGLLLVTLCWHLSRRAAWCTLVLPWAVGLFVCWLWTLEAATLRGWGFRRIGVHALLQCFGLALGIRFGRPIVRTVLPFLLPPGLLQHLAFLWHADGHPLPKAGRGVEPGPDPS